MGRTLITAKVNPDLDGVACIYAYCELLKSQNKDVVGGVFGKAHVEAQYLIDRFDIDDIVYDPKEDWSNFILVDASDTVGMPGILRADDTIEIIDHRSVYEPERTFPNAKIQNELIGAAATLISEKYYHSPIRISRNSAVLLYGAIYSNTLNLKARVTNERDLQAVEWLRKQTEIPDQLIHEMFTAKTMESEKDLQEVLIKSDFKSFGFGKYSVGITQLEVVGAGDLINRHKEEILDILEEARVKFNLDFVFLNAIDVEEGFNLFVTPYENGQQVLGEVFSVEFENGIARHEGLLLRKEIIPLLKQHLS